MVTTARAIAPGDSGQLTNNIVLIVPHMGIVCFVPSSPVARASRIALHPSGNNGTHAQFSIRFYDASRVVHIGRRAHQGDLIRGPVVLRAYVAMIAGLAELFEQGKARVVPFALATLVIDQVANVVAQPSVTSRYVLST